MADFSYSVNSDASEVTFAGSLNETATEQLKELAGKLKGNCTFNFRGVVHVNSVGVLAWLRFISGVIKNRKVSFEDCTPEVVSNINMIPDFAGKAEIKSVFRQYHCLACEKSSQIHIKRKDFPAADGVMANTATPVCPKCGGTVETDELDAEFFSFLQAS